MSSVLSKQVDALGDKYAQLVETPDGWAFYTSGPIYDGDRLAGVVLVGSMLSSFLPSVKAEALADVTVYDFDGSPLATTFADAQNNTEVNLTPAGDAARRRRRTSTVREHKTLYGRDFDMLYGKIVIRDEAVGRYSIALPSSFILNAGATTRWQMGLLFTVATLAVLFTGLLIARSLTRPLLKLVSVAVAVTAGDLTARAQRAEHRRGRRARGLVQQHDGAAAAAAPGDDQGADVGDRCARPVHARTLRARRAAGRGASARSSGSPESELQHLEIGGYLHDIGKIGVRDSVLLKPGALTPEERKMIEMHPTIGLEILAPVDLAPEVIAFVAGHHEKLDGSGYPAHIARIGAQHHRAHRLRRGHLRRAQHGPPVPRRR